MDFSAMPFFAAALLPPHARRMQNASASKHRRACLFKKFIVE
jgi:hypothetical protein